MNGGVALLVLAVLLYGVSKKTDCAGAMIAGVREGIDTAVGILPSLVCMMVAIGTFRLSGLMDQVIQILSPLLGWTGLPKEVLPLILVRPMSGSASLAMAKELMDTFGPDSAQALAGSVLCASGETLFYVLAVYTGASGVRKTGYTVPAALFAWLCGVLAAAIAWPLAK